MDNEIDWNIVFSGVSAIATAITAGIAFRALKSWKREYRGKTKLELAGEILTGVEDMRDLLTVIRSPFCPSAELDDITNEYFSDTKKKPSTLKISYLAPYYRFNKNREKIVNFMKLRNKAILYWSDDVMKSFDELWKIFIEIKLASEYLYQYDKRSQKDTDKDESIIWSHAVGDLHPNEPEKQVYDEKGQLQVQDNETTKKIDSILNEIRTNIESELGKRKPWILNAK